MDTLRCDIEERNKVIKAEGKVVLRLLSTVCHLHILFYVLLNLVILQVTIKRFSTQKL